MKRNSNENIYTLFADWLKQIESQLNVALVRAPYKKGKIYYFKGIPENFLSLQIDDGGIVVWVFHEGEAVEMLRDIDAVLGYKRGNGYYCKLCNVPEYYPSIKKFYTDHCFSKLLKWINMELALSKYLEICFEGSGSSWATLDINIRFRKKLKEFVKSAFSFKENLKVKKFRVKLWA